jgi:peroxiredoxin family protein
MEDEINPMDKSVKKDGSGNTPCMSKVLRENMDGVVEVSACDKADDSKGKKRKDDLVDYFHQGSGAESKLRMDL